MYKILILFILLFTLPTTSIADRLTEEEQSINVAAMLQQSSVIVQSSIIGMGQGTGFYVSPHQVLTNHHVMGEGLTATITDYAEKECAAKITYWNQDPDLALLTTDCTGMPLTITEDVRAAQTVMSIGNPFGEDFFVSKGIVGSIRRGDYIAIDSYVDGGSSGGAVVNLKGEVLGVTRLKFNHTNNMGLAISSKAVNAFLRRNEGK